MLQPKKITKKDIILEGRFLRNQRESKAPTQLQFLKSAITEKRLSPMKKVKSGGSTKNCWPGYEKKGSKTMYGKTYNNCVKK